MATVEQIERDIAALEAAVKVIAAELLSIYKSYLTTLGQAVRQQLILASYHLCTQGYPEPFLRLSFSARQQLQQAIRKLGQNAMLDHLLAYLKIEDKSQESEDGRQEGDNIYSLSSEENPIPPVTPTPREIPEFLFPLIRWLWRNGNKTWNRRLLIPKNKPMKQIAYYRKQGYYLRNCQHQSLKLP